MAENGEQNAPIMAGSDDASQDEKIVGILAQVRQDHHGQPVAVVQQNLIQRFEQAQVEVDDITVERFASDIAEA